MNLLLSFLLLVTTVATASARQEELAPKGVSPDKRYTIFVEQTADPDATIYYVIRDRRTKEVLGRLKSSYQPGPDDDGDFAWKQSHPSWIYWRKDSRAVSIDEANHRREGTVLIARRTAKVFQMVQVSSEALMRASKQPWERGRLFFGEWDIEGHATVGLLGLVWADPESTPLEKRRRTQSSCFFTIALANGDVISIDPQTDETK